MSGKDAGSRHVRRPDARHETATAEPLPGEAPWLLEHRVELPDPIEGYVERPELDASCVLTDRRADYRMR